MKSIGRADGSAARAARGLTERLPLSAKTTTKHAARLIPHMLMTSGDSRLRANRMPGEPGKCTIVAVVANDGSGLDLPIRRPLRGASRIATESWEGNTE